MPARSKTRTKARTRALDLLFEAEARGVNVGQLLEDRLVDPDSRASNNPYTAQLVRGVVSHWTAIDAALTEYSHGWPLERMPAVDRAILRVGTWEVLYSEDVPDGVAISEAAALAAELSTDGSPAFVKGLLSRIAEVKDTLV